MKSLIIILSLFLCFSCKDREDDDNTNTTKENSFLILKVDYTSNTFEGLAEVEMMKNEYSADSLPMNVDYVSPGDFGGITLYHSLTNDSIFDATIIWMGEGEINYPTYWDLNPARKLTKEYIAAPNVENVTFINSEFNYEDYKNIDLDSIWSSINDYQLLKDYFMRPNAKVGVFLYTPTVGLTDYRKAKWIIFIYNA